MGSFAKNNSYKKNHPTTKVKKISPKKRNQNLFIPNIYITKSVDHKVSNCFISAFKSRLQESITITFLVQR
jgi:hypothetical protein